MVHVVGVSGKIGAGKNYLAYQLSLFLTQLGYTTAETTYATPLKNDVTKIINIIRENPSPKFLADSMDIDLDEAENLFKILIPEMETTPDLGGWFKTKAIRTSLQYYGTDIRRKQDNDYWVKRIDQYVEKDVDFVFIPDVRFPNEADWVKDFYNGTVYRLDVPIEVRRERVLARDSNYDENAFHHESETALDNYPRFDVVVGETFRVREIIPPLLDVSKL